MRPRPRYRRGRCYELAWRCLAYDERFALWDLVHGEIVSPIGNGDRIGHAWLANDQQVYDPVSNHVFDWSDYLKKYKARAIARYRAHDAMLVSGQHHHYGPWPVK